MTVFIKKYRLRLALLTVLLLALFLRVYALDRVPVELFGDELDVGYQAYSLWTTGRDYMGNSLPFYLQSINEWRAPLLMYAAAPFVGIFGLNEWGVRLPSAIFGVINVFLVYLLIKNLSKNSSLALVTAFVFSVIPWHIHYSRAGFESTLLLSLVLFGTITFLERKWVLSAISFSLSLYAYNTANIFVPLLVLGLVLLNKDRNKLLTKKAIGAAILLLFLVLPLLIIVFNGQGATRFRSLSIFNNPKTIDQIVFKRTTGSSSIERLFHNKLTYWSKSFFSNYLISFSPQFLFINGDPNPRHNVPLTGELSWWMLPFLLIGAVGLLKSRDEEFKKVVVLWLLLSPIPSALTIDGGNHATRLILMVPALAGIIGYGVYKLSLSWKHYLAIAFISLISLGFWLHEYYVHYPKEQSHYWDAGYKEPLVWLKDNQSSFSRIILNNSHDPILLRYLFWTAKDPQWLANYYKGDQAQEDIIEGFDGFTVDNVFFGRITVENKEKWLRENLDEKTAYLAFQKDEVPGDWNWETSPPGLIKVLTVSKDAFSNEPYIYVLTKNNEN